MAPYLVLLALAALGLALGWRLTLAPEKRSELGLPRLLQLTIAGTGLVVIALLMLPLVMTIGAIECTPETEAAGACLIGVEERGLFGGSIFACLIGVSFSFVLRKGVLDFPEVETTGEPVVKPEPKPKPKPAVASEPEPDAREPEPKPDESASNLAKTADPDPEDSSSALTSTHRRLEGPVFQAFVDASTVDLDLAIVTGALRLRSARVAVVFSRGASKEANEAVLELADVFDAYRYVLEGTAAATENLGIGDRPDPHEADEIAGPDARHAMQLALDLAGGLIETVFLVDTRVAFPEFVLGQLSILQSVCIAHAHDDVSAACQVVLPGTNLGEHEGDLDSGDEINQRRPRTWLVERLVEVARELERVRLAEAAAEAAAAEPAAAAAEPDVAASEPEVEAEAKVASEPEVEAEAKVASEPAP